MTTCCLSLSAQEEKGKIGGIVVETGSNNRVANVSIVNKRTNASTSTGYTGEFYIDAAVGDTLIISKLGYHNVSTEIKTLSDILIDFRPNAIQIETVTVERKSKEAEMEDIMDGYRKQGVYYEGKPKTLQYIFTPVTALYERFGRTPQNARRFRNYMLSEMEESTVDKLFNATRIQLLTGLEGDDLINFMAWYRPSYEKAAHWGEYDITKYIQHTFKQFERDGRPPAPKLPKLEVPPQQK